MNIEDFLKTATSKEKIDKITELKTEHQSNDVKLIIQKIQQTL